MPPQLRPQLIGLDLDGTVVDRTNHIPADVADAIRACHAAGITVAFLTGRRPITAGPHLDTIGLHCKAATNSGCLRWEYPGWQLTGARYFDPELVQPLADMLAPYSANFFVNSMETGFEYFLLDRQPTPELEEYVARYGYNIRRVHDPREIDGANITQIAMLGPAEVVQALRDRINTELNGRVLALAVRWPLLDVLALELFHPQANKGDALSQFATELGIPRERTLAVGDDVNDLAMLRWAGYGAAMPAASPELAAAADEALNGDGVHALAAYLETLLELPKE